MTEKKKSPFKSVSENLPFWPNTKDQKEGEHYFVTQSYAITKAVNTAIIDALKNDLTIYRKQFEDEILNN